MIDRLRRLREATAAIGADGAIVTHPANRHYFSGFPADDHAPDESAGVLLVSKDSAILFTSPTNLPWVESAVRPPVKHGPGADRGRSSSAKSCSRKGSSARRSKTERSRRGSRGDR